MICRRHTWGQFTTSIGGGKETKRTVDYRCALIMVSNQVRGFVDTTVQLLLDTLAEIQEIAYSSDAQRTPRSVLRLHNLTWYHGMLCRSVIRFSLKQMTTRKFYGNYFHNITSHAPIQNRLISGRSAYTEEQERVFTTINHITRMTSSYHPDHVIGNVFIRVQAEKDLKSLQPSISDTQEAHVTKLASSLPKFGNTVIPNQMLTRNSRVWQAHLERISDFLLAGGGIWWRTCRNGDIEFFDAEQNPEAVSKGPKLHHFRSSNFKAEENYLRDCWKMCLERKVAMPIDVGQIQIENAEGNMVFLKAQETVCRNEQNGNVEMIIDTGVSDRLNISSDCMSKSANIEVVSEESKAGCDVLATDGQVDLEKNAVGVRGEKKVDECNVKLVEVSSDICLSNDLQEEASQDENRKDVNGQSREGIYKI